MIRTALTLYLQKVVIRLQGCHRSVVTFKDRLVGTFQSNHFVWPHHHRASDYRVSMHNLSLIYQASKGSFRRQYKKTHQPGLLCLRMRKTQQIEKNLSTVFLQQITQV